MKKRQRRYRVLKNLSMGNEIVKPGAIVDLGHLDEIGLNKLVWRKAVEELPNIPEDMEVSEDEA